MIGVLPIELANDSQFLITEVMCPATALEILNVERPDVIVLDTMVSGTRIACRVLRSTIGFRDIARIILTNGPQTLTSNEYGETIIPAPLLVTYLKNMHASNRSVAVLGRPTALP
jgi:CheY-like chemotaxis protein